MSTSSSERLASKLSWSFEFGQPAIRFGGGPVAAAGGVNGRLWMITCITPKSLVTVARVGESIGPAVSF